MRGEMEPISITVNSTIVEYLGRPHAAIYGVLKGACRKRDTNICQVSQVFIDEGAIIQPKKQRKYTTILEEWKLIEVCPGDYKIRHTYKVPLVNYLLFTWCPEEYMKAVQNGTMELFLADVKIERSREKEFVATLIEGAIIDNVINPKKVGKNLTNYLEKTPEKIPPQKGVIPPPLLVLRNRKNHERFIPYGGSGSYKKQILSKHTIKDCVQCTSQGSAGVEGASNLKSTNFRSSKTTNFAPRENKKPVSTKRKTIDKFALNKDFYKIKTLWNTYPTRKVGNLNPDKENKTLDTTLQAVKALLSGSLFNKGITTLAGKKLICKLPKDFNIDKEIIDVQWLLDKIERFGRILIDDALAPRDKTFISKVSLGEFILGKQGRQEQQTSILFDDCCGDFKTLWDDPNAKITNIICRTVLELQNKRVDAYTVYDQKLVAEVSKRVVIFANKNKSHHLGGGNPSRVAIKFVNRLKHEKGPWFMKMGFRSISNTDSWQIFEDSI